MLSLMLLCSATKATPFESILAKNGFSIVDRFERRYDIHATGTGFTVSETYLRDDRRAKFLISSSQIQASALEIYENTYLLSARAPTGTQSPFLDTSPAGRLVFPDQDSVAIQLRHCKVGESLQSASGSFLASDGFVTNFSWMPVGNQARNSDWGQSEDELRSPQAALMRWYDSANQGAWNFVDYIQRVAGREMVTKVDKDQNVYVDMNELSRHRGWNFSISLEPARADVRIGNDHIKIYPGADRIHINDELVTLPGTVPIQGYGVYLPLRLLQERGYLPAEG